jgi:hypothetical protein
VVEDQTIANYAMDGKDYLINPLELDERLDPPPRMLLDFEPDLVLDFNDFSYSSMSAGVSSLVPKKAADAAFATAGRGSF